jgi:hypothetical protein
MRSQVLAIPRLAVSVGLLALLFGCGQRPISDSGYYADSDRAYGARSSPLYKGELSEFAVLGIEPGSGISEAEIREALAQKDRVVVPKGSSIMLVQSGAMIPDEPMVKVLEKYYSVAVFSGVPQGTENSGGSYAKALRLAAAKAGHQKVVAYWGVLETGRESLVTKVVSWVPFVGGIVPDETQRMRIRLKVALVDVETGRWEMFVPEPFEDTDINGRYSRISSDQAQVAVLKEKGYTAAAEDLAKRYSR